MTKGDSIYENSKYLQLNLAPGTWEVTIASPTTTYGGFVG